MSSSSDDDGQQRFALGFIFALITLIVSSVIGMAVFKNGSARAPAPMVETHHTGASNACRGADSGRRCQLAR